MSWRHIGGCRAQRALSGWGHPSYQPPPFGVPLPTNRFDGPPAAWKAIPVDARGIAGSLRTIQVDTPQACTDILARCLPGWRDGANACDMSNSAGDPVAMLGPPIEGHEWIEISALRPQQTAPGTMTTSTTTGMRAEPPRLLGYEQPAPLASRVSFAYSYRG